jgi:diketogulonate reductase-like aldo/keto reductase
MRFALAWHHYAKANESVVDEAMRKAVNESNIPRETISLTTEPWSELPIRVY